VQIAVDDTGKTGTPPRYFPSLSCTSYHEDDLFKNNSWLVMIRYPVQSQVSLADVHDFVSASEDKSMKMNGKNLPGLSQLAEEFCFQVVGACQDCLMHRE
jgi:hypothetical protein